MNRQILTGTAALLETHIYDYSQTLISVPRCQRQCLLLKSVVDGRLEHQLVRDTVFVAPFHTDQREHAIGREEVLACTTV